MLINLETFSDKIKRVITYIYKDYGINSLEEYNNIPIATKKEILLKNYADFSKEKATFLLNSALYSNEVLKEANDYYYNKSESLITDFEYDIIFDYLKTIIDVFPTIKEKIWKPLVIDWLINQNDKNSGFQKWKHKVPLLSMQNTYNEKDILDFHAGIKRIFPSLSDKELEYVIEPKFDGLSIALTYEKWILVEAKTRGNGEIGDIVTENIKQIDTIPLKLKGNYPNTLIIRGEVLFPKSSLEKINIIREQEWKEPFSNTRNAASWTLKLLDPQEVKRRWLTCFVYDILYTSEKLNNSKQFDETQFLHSLWFLTGLQIDEFKNSKIYQINNVIAFIQQEKLLSNLLKEDIDFDWLVVKLNNKKLQEEAGYTGHHPKFAFAYKFPTQQVSTKLKGVEYSIWRTGTITPVGLLEPVEIWNVIVSRVSLHNFALCREKGIKINDYLFIQRSGEVIPYVLWVDHSKPNLTNEKPIDSITNCPVCKTLLNKGEIFYTCPNENCMGRKIETIAYFTSKEALDIVGVWPSVAKLLVELNLVKEFDDLFSLNNEKVKSFLISQPWFGEKKYTQIINGIEEAKTKPIERKLSSLGILWLWKTVSKLIINNLNNMSFNNGVELFDYIVKNNFLINIEGIWPEISTQIIKWWENQKNKDLIKRLEEKWFNFNYSRESVIKKDIQEKNANSLFQVWEHFSLTWTLPFWRNEIVEKLEGLGLIFDSTPKKTTNYLLVGDKAGSKLEKAQSMWIKCLIGWDACIEVFQELKEL